MKYCEEYTARLDLFVDGELSPEEMEQVREHLAACPGCRAYVDDALAIRAGFPDVEETVVPEGFVESVMERIQISPPGGEKEAKQRRRWVSTAAALAACCALVVLVQTVGVTKGGVSPGYDGGEEAGIEPQMAAADSAEPEESARLYTTAKKSEPAEAAEEAAGSVENRRRSMVAAAPPAEAAAEAAADMAAAYTEMALCLTAGEAGDLLDEFVPEEEDASKRRYALSLEEYEALLEALGRWEKLPDTPERSFQVVVTGPFE